ncbi:hypothetical protein H2200_001589 [Cladophialophora chaetospira]|uniref:Major facilitator superfamily (MFS) profile domain-containing protein n=1 Tax=Cladophialophora chaetospira TaxID=386627 RepID=A0AA38XL71_9EURO|nr:hypothetical protein H2200_001589 [Cladophialophora chaetospira]
MSPPAHIDQMPAVEPVVHLSQAAGVGATSPTLITDTKDGAGKEEIWEENSSRTGPFDEKEVKRAIRRIDIIVVPVLTVFLAFCFIDRANMGLAAVAGMTTEIGLVGYQYSITLLLFFPGYVLFALPSNYLLSKVSVRIWLCTLGMGFGLFTLIMGVIKNFAGLAVMRLFLGVFEAGVLPAIIVILGSWYPRYKLGKRVTLVYCGANLSAAFAGILAYAFSRINVGSYHGWRWIFLLEGIITMVVVVGMYFLVDEYPQTSKWLTKTQREIALHLISQDREEKSDEKMTLKVVLSLMRNPIYWIFGAIYMVSASAIYSMAYFLPLILHSQMGFTGAMSQVLTTPPSIWAFILATILTAISDRYKIRSPFILFFSCNVIMGVSLTRWGPNTASQYIGAFLTMGGLFGGLSTILSFASNNAPSRVKRSVAAGIQLSMGACGGIIGSTIFRSQDAPTYTPGVVATIAMMGAQLLMVCGLILWMARQNKLHKEQGKVLEGQPDFLYTL